MTAVDNTPASIPDVDSLSRESRKSRKNFTPIPVKAMNFGQYSNGSRSSERSETLELDHVFGKRHSEKPVQKKNPELINYGLEARRARAQRIWD